MMELEITTLSRWNRLLLWTLIVLGLFSVLWFADFWFFSDARRDPLWFPMLSVAIFWGIYRSVANWFLYFFLTPEPVNPHAKPESLQAGVVPSVDVLTTAMPGEPFAMFMETLHAIQKIETPHRTFLLDGGNDPNLIQLCQSLGVNHVDCRNIGGAKAGKINYCLKNLSNAEIVLVIDPDHRPRADIFTRILPYFADPKVGFVQIVQAYYNGKNSFVANAADEQTYGFYGPALMSLNGLGIPTAIGANCVFRRKALDSIGGHAEHLAEDALTSMRIHAEGWTSVYYPYRGSHGLVPEDLASFFKQQYKWATGMFYLFFYEYPRLVSQFSWPAKVHYFNAGTYYFGGVSTFMTLVLPVYFLFSREYAVEFGLFEFLLHLLPYMFTTLSTYFILQRFYTHSQEKRVPWRSLVLEKGSWHIFAMGFVSAILRKKVQYIPTPKESDRAPMPILVLPHIFAIILSAGAVLFGFFGYPRIEGGTALMMFFAALNIAFLLPVTFIALLPRFNWRGNHA